MNRTQKRRLSKAKRRNAAANIAQKYYEKGVVDGRIFEQDKSVNGVWFRMAREVRHAR